MTLWQRVRHAFLRHRSLPVRHAPDTRMGDREAAAEEFYDAMGWVAGQSGPAWVSDGASVLDLLDGDEDEHFVSERVRSHYGVALTSVDLEIPFWLLLDRLAERRG